MNEEQLRELLQTADEAAPPPRVHGGLTARVRHRARARWRLRAAGGVAVVALIVAGTAAWLTHGGWSPKSQIVNGIPQDRQPLVDVAGLKSQYALLEVEARQHQLTAAAILRLESQARREAQAADAAGRARMILARPDALAELAERRDRTARILIGRGDSLLHQPGGKSAAAESYKNVVDLFPDTPEATVARDRLGQIKA